MAAIPGLSKALSERFYTFLKGKDPFETMTLYSKAVQWKRYIKSIVYVRGQTREKIKNLTEAINLLRQYELKLMEDVVEIKRLELEMTKQLRDLSAEVVEQER